jgi:hypothetical protein
VSRTPTPLHPSSQCTWGYSFPEGVSLHSTWTAAKAEAATTAFPLQLKTQNLEKRSNWAFCASIVGRQSCSASLPNTDARVTWLPQCQRKWCNYPLALGQPYGKCPVTAQALLAQGSHPAPSPKPTVQGQVGEPVFEYTLSAVYPALYTTIQAYKKLSQQVIHYLCLHPSSSSLQVTLTTKSCFLWPMSCKVQLLHWPHMHNRNIIEFNYSNYDH